jgi:hypothetical protein
MGNFFLNKGYNMIKNLFNSNTSTVTVSNINHISRHDPLESAEYYATWCGTTMDMSGYLCSGSTTVGVAITKIDISGNELLIHQKTILKYLKKRYQFITDLTLTLGDKFTLSFWVEVSPTHYSELMDPKIEKVVKEKLLKEINYYSIGMINSKFKDKLDLIFIPQKSETILEFFK